MDFGYWIGEIRRAREIGFTGWNKYIWMPCSLCHKTRWVRLTRERPRSKFCPKCVNKIRTGNNHPRWNNGEFIDANGYIRTLQPNHPHCDSKGYVYKHRLIAEGLLGRYLGYGEVVHHIDGNKLNNEQPNLMLLKSTAVHSAMHKGK